MQKEVVQNVTLKLQCGLAEAKVTKIKPTNHNIIVNDKYINMIAPITLNIEIRAHEKVSTIWFQ